MFLENGGMLTREEHSPVVVVVCGLGVFARDKQIKELLCDPEAETAIASTERKQPSRN